MNDRVITRRKLIEAVAQRWQSHYLRDGQWSKFAGNSESIYYLLLKLDLKTCPASDVDAIIGNDSWTTMTCDQCRKPVDAVVEVGAPPDYESSTAKLCFTCIKSSMERLKTYVNP